MPLKVSLRRKKMNIYMKKKFFFIFHARVEVEVVDLFLFFLVEDEMAVEGLDDEMEVEGGLETWEIIHAILAESLPLLLLLVVTGNIV